MDTKKIGKFLRDLRREHNLTQEELGDKLGATNKTISRWETGTYLPPADILLAMSKLYGVSVNEILSGERLATADYQPKAEENIVTTLKTSQKLSRGQKTLIICGSVFLAIVLALLGLYLFFISLFPHYSAQFVEGVYAYQGDTLELANGVVIETIELTFKQIDKQTFDDANGINVIKNKANDKLYALSLSAKLTNGDIESFTVKSRAGGGLNLYDLEIIESSSNLIQIRYIRLSFNTNEYKVAFSIDCWFDIVGYENSNGVANHGIVLKLRDDSRDILW